MNIPLNGQLQPDTGGAFLTEAYGYSLQAHRPVSNNLEGIRFAVKDVFDIAGTRTGAGNPVWFSDH